MSNESVMRDLFDRWEQVWHAGQYALIPSCVGQTYIRHDEKGDRTVTLEDYAAEIAASGRSGRAYVSSCTTTRLQATDRGSALYSSGPIQRPASCALGPVCSPTELRAANSRRLGLCSSHSARHGQTQSRKSIGRARRRPNRTDRNRGSVSV